MKIFKTSDPSFKTACENLVESRKLRSRAEKLENSAKKFITESLNIDLKALPLNETLLIKLRTKVDYEDCLRILVKARNMVDLGKLLQEYPEIEKDCRKDFPVVCFDPLICTENTLENVVQTLEDRKKDLMKSLKSIERLAEKVSKK